MMKYILTFILCLYLFSCAGLKSDIPQDLIHIKDRVDAEMVYDGTVPKWIIPEAEKGFFGEVIRKGSCTNYAVYYIKELHKLGYDANIFYPHVAVKVETDSGVYILDSAKTCVYKLEK